MTTQPNAQTLLAHRLVEAQPPLSASRAQSIAERVLDGNPEVAAAAMQWAESGRMPDTPIVQGHTPAEMARRYLPTQVFVTLSLIADDASLISLLDDLPMLALDPPPHADVRY